VLVDHPDPAGDGVGGGVGVVGTSVERYRPAVGVVEPVEHVHQRGLAGAVLAKQSVDLATPDPEVDVVVRDDTRKRLCDPRQLQVGLVGLWQLGTYREQVATSFF